MRKGPTLHHSRSYSKEQDIFDPLHYLTLLEQRPGAFEYAKPIKGWRKEWPQSYSRMLENLQEKWPEGRGVQDLSVCCSCIKSTLPIFLSRPLTRRFPTDACIWMASSIVCISCLNRKNPCLALIFRTVLICKTSAISRLIYPSTKSS